MAADEELKKIAGEVSVCTRCGLHSSRKLSVPGEGPANADILFIGEGPGFHENEQGRPFVGAAGATATERVRPGSPVAEVRAKASGVSACSSEGSGEER